MLDKKVSFKLPTEYENYDFENVIGQEEHNQHITNFKNQFFDADKCMNDLKKYIESLHELIQNIQKRNQNDYIKTFNQFMETVK